MPTPLQFLQSILPEDGFKCATVFNEGKVWNRFFATIAELAKFISDQDALGSAPEWGAGLGPGALGSTDVPGVV